MAPLTRTGEVRQNTIQLHDGSVKFGSKKLWQEAVQGSVASQNDNRPTKRRRRALSAPPTKPDRILLIRREVALNVADEATRSKLRVILDDLSEDISLDVSCSCDLPQKSADGEGSIFVYYTTRCTKENELLSFSFNVEDISSDAWGDIVWSCEAKGAPFERAYTFHVHYDGNRLALSLLIIVTAEASNTWSRKTLNTSKQNWQIFAHALPVGKPIIKNAGSPTPREFYLSVHVPDRDQQVPESVQHPELQYRLLPFQRRAVQWMLRRESVDLNKGEIVAYHAKGVPPTFFAQKGKGGDTCYMSHILGILSNDLQALQKERKLIKGGILAEEMGLGKTVELIALLCLHRRQFSPGDTIWDGYHGKDVRMSGATLIITPPSILHQWQNELKMHAPDIKVFTYEGVRRSLPDKDSQEIMQHLMQYDVVLTTYRTLSAEIHYALPVQERGLRKKKVYKPRRSPLVEISWWRVCLDEAQMVETGVSNAAVVAREIPRVNAWAISGTPVRKDIDDLFGLLLFLRYEPFCNKDVWSRLSRFNRDAFNALFADIALRHSKDIVRDEISLPPQHRMVVTVPFSQVEEQNYRELFSKMCEDIGFDTTGAPVSDGWDTQDASEKMRTWLMRLRQTCLHPEAGERNRKAFGLKTGPLRTVEEVLTVMIDQYAVLLRNNEKFLYSSMIKRGQLHERENHIKSALEVWRATLGLVQTTVGECRAALAQEIQKSNGAVQDVKARPKVSEDQYASGYDDDDESAEKKSSRVGAARLRLRTFLELEHACFFWIGTAYFQLKEQAQNEEKGKKRPGKSANGKTSEEYEQMESEYYDMAKRARLELMQETRSRAIKYIAVLEDKRDRQEFVEVPDIEPPAEGSGGIETGVVLDGIRNLANVLNDQVVLLDDWREKLIALLTEPLVDDDSGRELEGNEVEVSAEKQEESYAYMSAIRALVADRDESLTNTHNSLIAQDTRSALERPSKMHAELFRLLIAEKNRVNPLQSPKSMKRLNNELRALITTLKTAEDRGDKRAKLERTIAEQEQQALQKEMTTQVKACAELFKEIEFFRSASNARMQYYRQVQAVSDTLLPLDVAKEFGPRLVGEALFNKVRNQERALQKTITDAKSRNTYLAHLSNMKNEQAPVCLICTDSYEIGIITGCGHSYCKECIMIWYKTSRKCPTCNSQLKAAEFFQITYNPKNATMQQETHSESEPNSPGNGSKIYANVEDRVLREIRGIELEGSFGSKIDMITRHLVYLKETEPGFKAVVFSQWSDVLEVIKASFRRANIEFASLEKRDGIDKFRNNPEISCFLLHAKSQAAGLTLVNATHVFLCEPLLNVGLELQAISRVHRIGQTKTTTVWLYAVNNTVEQSVLELSTRRRMAFIGESAISSDNTDTEMMDVDKEIDEEQLDAAESNVLREGLAKCVERAPGGGEMVANDDLWDCLFCKVPQDPTGVKEIQRELMADAAESSRWRKTMSPSLTQDHLAEAV